MKITFSSQRHQQLLRLVCLGCLVLLFHHDVHAESNRSTRFHGDYSSSLDVSSASSKIELAHEFGRLHFPPKSQFGGSTVIQPRSTRVALVSDPTSKKRHPNQLDLAPEGTFSIVIIPDTQRYQGSGTKGAANDSSKVTNPIFEKWTDWIAANIKQQRIKFVSHVGDIVDVNHPAQWSIAKGCMDKLHGRVPYGISVGNHDMTGDGNSSLYQKFFPKAHFERFSWYGGCFENPNGSQSISGNPSTSLQLIEAGGMKFIYLHLECNAPDNVLHWANSTLEHYRDRRALITTHMGLGPRDKPTQPQDYFDAPKGRMLWTKRHGDRGNSPQQMWDKCFKLHPNLFMVCCGDQSRTQAMRQESIGEHGNPIHELLSDYGEGGIRVMRFIPSSNRIEVRTYDPVSQSLCESTSIVKDRDQHQFSIPYVMKPD